MQETKKGQAPVVNKPRVVIEDEEIPFTTITRETPSLPKGQTRLVTAGVNGRRSHFYSVTTAATELKLKHGYKCRSARTCRSSN